MASGTIAAALVIAAATATRPVLETLRPDLEKAAGGRVDVRYGATGTLASGIRKGDVADLFLAVDERSIRRLADDGLVEEGSLTRCATETLALVAKKGAPFELPRRLDGATALAFVKLPVRRLAVVSKKTAPEGVSAEEVLAAARILKQVKEKLVPVASADEAIGKVLSGDAEAAIVPKSLAGAPGLVSCPVDPTLHEPLKVTGGVVSASARKDAARRALDVVSGPGARETWKRFGFEAP
jgi:molybdate transport system substrate-binding protein